MRSRALHEDHLSPFFSFNSTWTSAYSATWDQCCDNETQQRVLKPSAASESLCSRNADSDWGGLGWEWRFCFLTSGQVLVTAPSLRNKKLSSKYRLQRLRMCVCAWALSRVWFFATPWTVAHWAPLSMN